MVLLAAAISGCPGCPPETPPAEDDAGGVDDVVEDGGLDTPAADVPGIRSYDPPLMLMMGGDGGEDGEPDCNDGGACTLDEWDPELGDCIHTPDNGFCDDSVDCTVDECIVGYGCYSWANDALCPPVECNYSYCKYGVGCDVWPLGDGTDCIIPPDIPGGCLGGVCVERGCGNGLVDPGEECETEVHLLGCEECLSVDWVVSDAIEGTPDDGREAVAEADRSLAVLDYWGSTNRFVVAWAQEEDDDPGYAQVRVRVVDIGTGDMDEILVTESAYPQQKPVVTALPYGGFAVAWHGYGTGSLAGDDVDVFLAVYDDTGGLVRRTRVNTTVAEAQVNPSIGSTTWWPGQVVVVWEDWSDSGEGTAGPGLPPDPGHLSGIRYRVFDTDGRPAAGWSSDALANEATEGAQVEPSVAVSPYGEFLIAWTDAGETAPDSDGAEIKARRFDASGSPTGAEFVMNADLLEGEQWEPSAAPVWTWFGFAYAVAWTHMEPDGRLTVRANVAPYTGPPDPMWAMELPSTDVRDQYAPTLAFDSVWYWSTLAATWVRDVGAGDETDDVSLAGIAGRRYYVTCISETSCYLEPFWEDEVFLNTTTHDLQETPSVAFGPWGTLTAVFTDWSGADGSGGLCEVRARHLPTGWVVPGGSP
jgi:hypothetical protein